MAKNKTRGVANPVKDTGASKRRTKEITDRAPPRGERGTGSHPGERGGITAGAGTEELGSAGYPDSVRPPLRGDITAAGGVESLEDWPASARKAVRGQMRGAAGKVGRSAGRTRTGGRATNRRKARSGQRQRGR